MDTKRQCASVSAVRSAAAADTSPRLLGHGVDVHAVDVEDVTVALGLPQDAKIPTFGIDAPNVDALDAMPLGQSVPAM